MNVYAVGSRHSYSGDSTVVPPPPEFPFLLPPPPRPHPTPLPGRGHVKLLSRRNLVQEAHDLSDEEAEVDDALLAVRNRGASFLIPLGKRYTLLEERADLQAGSDSTSTEMDGGSEHGESPAEDGDGEDEEEEHDLDASMENLDEEDEEDDEEEDEGEDDDEEAEEDDGSSEYESPEPEPLRRVT
ncbi:hypothetical protein FRC05_008648 [Tulasnella sp. 425]|nr:hypothetical protein FRC05_008648 [Tulasnella sp. 425]